MEEARIRPASSVVEVSISEMVHFEHNMYRGVYGALAAHQYIGHIVVLMDWL